MLSVGNGLIQEDVDIVHAMKGQVKFLLTITAVSHFPVLQHLSTSVPIFCPCFFTSHIMVCASLVKGPLKMLPNA